MNKLLWMAVPIAAIMSSSPSIQAQQANGTVQGQYHVDRPDLQSYIDATSSKDIIDQSTVFRDVAKNGKLGRLPPRYTRALVNGTKEITELLKGHESTADLGARARSDLDKTRWDIVNVMARFDPERVICSDVIITGSRIPQTQCMKVRDAIAAQEQAKRAANEMMNNMFCVRGGAVPCGS